MIIDEKFKTIHLAVIYTHNASKKNYLLALLLDDILTSHTDIHNSEKSIAIFKQEMYSCRILIASSFGTTAYTTFMLSIPNPRLVQATNLFGDAVQFLNELIYLHDKINIDIFENRKRMIIESYKALKNDKRLFSRVVFFDKLLEDTSIPSFYESLDIMENVSLEEIRYFYKEVLLTGRTFSVINGPCIEDELVLFKDTFKSDSISATSPYGNLKNKKFQMLEQKIDSPQTELAFAYQIFVTSPRESLLAVIANIVLGNSFESRLFSKIREELALCYDISSQYSRRFSVITITAGVDPKKEKEAVREINKIVTKFIEFGVLEAEFSLAVKKIMNDIYNRSDSQMSFINDEIEKNISGINTAMDSKIELLNTINTKEINDFIKTFKPYLTYIFKGDR